MCALRVQVPQVAADRAALGIQLNDRTATEAELMSSPRYRFLNPYFFRS